jgi:hypothetical protein
MGTTTATAIVPCWLSPWLTGFGVWRTPVVDAEVEDRVEDVVVGGVVAVEVLWTVTVDVEVVDVEVVDVEELEEEVVEERVVVEEVVVVDELEVVAVVVEDEVLGMEVDDWDEVVLDELVVGGLVGVFGVVVDVVGSAGVVGVGRDGPELVVLEDMLRDVNTSLARCLCLHHLKPLLVDERSQTQPD